MVIDPSAIITPALQLLSAVASVGRVRTKSYVVSRRFNALALGAVAGGFRDQVSLHRACRSSGWPSGLHDPDGTHALASLFRDDRSGGVPAACHLCSRL